MEKSNSKVEVLSLPEQGKKNIWNKGKLVDKILQRCINHKQNERLPNFCDFQFVSAQAEEEIKAFLSMTKNIYRIVLLLGFLESTESSEQFIFNGSRVQDHSSNGIVTYLGELQFVAFHVYSNQKDSKQLDEALAAIQVAGFEKYIIFCKKSLPLTVSEVVALQSIKNRISLKLSNGILKMDSQMEGQLAKLSPNLRQLVLDEVNVENPQSLIRAINQLQNLQQLQIQNYHSQNPFLLELQNLKSNIQQLYLQDSVLCLKVLRKVLSNNLSLKKLYLTKCEIVMDPELQDQHQSNDKQTGIWKIKFHPQFLDRNDQNYDQNYIVPLYILRRSLNLTSLSILGNMISDKFIQKITILKQLKDIHLESVNLSDRGLIYLSKFKNVEILSLYNININSRILQRLFLKLKECKECYCEFNSYDYSSESYVYRNPNAKRLKENIDYSLRIQSDL